MSDGEGIGMSFGFTTGDGASQPNKVRPPVQAEVSFSSSDEYNPLPFRLLALANFRGCPGERSTTTYRLQRGRLDEAFAQLDVSLYLQVEDMLGRDPKGLEVRYSPRALHDLRPDKVAAAVPELKPLHQLLSDVASLQEGKLSSADFRAGLSRYTELPSLTEALRLVREGLGELGGTSAAAPAPARPAPKAAKPSGTVDDIFAMMDAGGAPSEPTASQEAIGSAVSAIGGGSSRGTSGKLRQAQEVLAALWSKQLSAILHHPQFRQVEAAWRGLALLADRTEFSRVQLELMDVAPENAVETFHQSVFPQEYEGRSEHPLSLSLIDLSFQNTPADLAALRQLAEDALAIQAPLLTGAGQEFLGTSAPELAAMNNPRELFSGGFAEWESLRKGEASRWLVLAYNRLLLRIPYRPSRRWPHFTELTEGPEDLLWGHPGWAVAVAISQSMKKLGWPTAIMGLRHGEVETCPMWIEEESHEVHGPLEASLSENALSDLSAAGFLPLTCQPQRDSVFLLTGETACSGGQAGDPRGRSTLAYQLLAARLGETVLANKTRLSSATSAEGITQAYRGFLSNVLGDTGPGAGVRVDVAPDTESPGKHLVRLEARTGQHVLGGAEVQLALRV